jgi:predicted O-methyltransferase YrrM
MTTERYAVPDDQAAIERRRLAYLAEARDPRTFVILDQLGLRGDHSAWELGAGAGTVAAWMGERVGPNGHVWSTDIDTQFHGTVPGNVRVEQHDVVHDAVPKGAFDVVHARAVLQHIGERDSVLETLVDALKPGGVIVIEESDFQAFSAQKLPEPLASVHALINSAQPAWREANYGTRVPFELRALGCTSVETVGDSWTMRANEASGEWWYLAVERIRPHLVDAGVVSAADFDEAIAQMRAPGFTMIGPLSLAIHGRKPK